MELSKDEFETLSTKQVLALLYGYINTRFGSNNSLCSELINNAYSDFHTMSVYISKRNIRRMYINQLIEIKLIIKYTLEFIDRLSDQQRTSINDELFCNKFIDYLHNDLTACDEDIDIAYYRLTQMRELTLPFKYTYNVYLYRSQEMFKHIAVEAFYSFEQICNDVYNSYESILNKDCE